MRAQAVRAGLRVVLPKLGTEPRETGTLLSDAVDQPSGTVIVQVDARYRTRGDDGLREVGYRQVQVVVGPPAPAARVLAQQEHALFALGRGQHIPRRGVDTSLATKRRILAQRLGAEPQPVQALVRFRAERDPSAGGRLWYRVGGVGYASLKALRAAFPGAKLERLPATRRTRLFG